MKLNRDEFLETGYLIVKEAVPRDKLERVRQAYETLVDRQRENWKAERAENDPPGGVWETAPQPRLQLSRSPLVNQIDQETAPAVEVWLEENIHGVSTELLDIADGAVTEMMMMCNPVRDHGPAKWHRDHHPIDTAPLQGYIDDILEGGPRYVQWNIPLYDDSVLWVIPGSHLRLNTPKRTNYCWQTPAARCPMACRPISKPVTASSISSRSSTGAATTAPKCGEPFTVASRPTRQLTTSRLPTTSLRRHRRHSHAGTTAANR